MNRKILKFIFVLALNILLIYVLDTRMSGMPPLAKILNPFQGFWQNAESRHQLRPTKIELEDLPNTTNIIYDKQYVPHIFAADEPSLYFAQGYITAVLRLWQMEFQIYFAAGRISEIIGENGLKSDRFQRRRGMVYAAEKALETSLQNPKLKTLFESYAAGVNAYIDRLSYRNFPLEYKLLDYRPEKWTILKSVLLSKYMAATLTAWDADLEHTNALKKFGRKYFDMLYPEKQVGQDPIVNTPDQWHIETKMVEKPQHATFSNNLIYTSPYEKPDPFNGSNNWAVSGAKTASGNAILCGDPHLRLSLPAIWMSIQLNSPQINTYGVSLPGTPGVIIGFNDSIAWSFTNARRDVVDWYSIQFKEKNYHQYYLDSQWVNTAERVEKILIRNQDIFYDTVYYTTWGPVVYDKNFVGKKVGQEGLALRWLGHDPYPEGLVFYLLNKAKNYRDYTEAIQHLHCPAQNAVYADVHGNIAIWVQGKFPIKWKEQGKFVMDGSYSSNRWQGFIPQEHNAHSYNPKRCFVSSANQYPVDSTYPYYVYDAKYEFYRNRRINSLLDSLDSLSVQDMMQIQNDNYNLKAAESLPYFLSLLNLGTLTAQEMQVFQKLSQWNFYNEPQSQAATYYEAWFDALMPLLWDEMQDTEVPLAKPVVYNTIHILKTMKNFEFIDIKSTVQQETTSDIISIAFKKAVASLIDNNQLDTIVWGHYKSTTIKHLSQQIKAFDATVYNGGNHNIINASSERHGPSWRMVVELDKKGVKAWGVYPGGQSGNPGSYYYDNLIPEWTKGAYYPLIFMHSEKDFRNQVLFKQQLIKKE